MRLILNTLTADNNWLNFVELFGVLDDLQINRIDLVFNVLIFPVFLIDLIFGRFFLFNLKLKLIDFLVEFLVLLKVLCFLTGQIFLLLVGLLLNLLLISLQLIQLHLAPLLLTINLIDLFLNWNQINLTILMLLKNPLKLAFEIKGHFLLSNQVLMRQSQILSNFLKVQKFSGIDQSVKIGKLALLILKAFPELLLALINLSLTREHFP